jgi:hypothetical protein
VRRTLVSGLLLMAGIALATNAAAATVDYRRQPFIARGSDALRDRPRTSGIDEWFELPFPPRWTGKYRRFAPHSKTMRLRADRL